MSDDLDYDRLSPGIRETVRWLQSLGYETTDSGDGSFHAAGMPCAVPEPMVVVRSRYPARILRDADDIHMHVSKLFASGRMPKSVSIDASYSPCDRIAVVVVAGLDDKMLAEAKEKRP